MSVPEANNPLAQPCIGVSIVMPCLNEVDCLPNCIANAQQALAIMAEKFGLSGEIVIADNGSTDGSQRLAEKLGARVVPVAARGYGAALSGGFTGAYGRYLIMGDADGSYDFRDAVAMVEKLVAGAEFCMGSRFKGGIAPGAMPWKNRYIGNPVLTGVLNLLFHSGIDDAHCGLRALTKTCFEKLELSGQGMEFASEMVIKATLKGVRIAEVPATLSPDLRNRPPHLRPWRDGWRHLRYLVMLSPAWAFAAPAAFVGMASLLVLGYALMAALAGFGATSVIGNYWIILAGSMLGVSHVALLLAAATELYGVREGYRRPTELSAWLVRWVSLESMLIAGIASVVTGLGILFAVAAYWSVNNFGPIGNVLPAVLGTLLVAIGVQNAFGGFLLAILHGNEADFMKAAARPRTMGRAAPVAVVGAVSQGV